MVLIIFSIKVSDDTNNLQQKLLINNKKMSKVTDEHPTSVKKFDIIGTLFKCGELLF